MAVMLAASQLHEKSAFSIHAHLGSRTTGLLDRTGERAHVGRVLLVIDQVEACWLPCCIRRWKRVVVFPTGRRSAVR